MNNQDDNQIASLRKGDIRAFEAMFRQYYAPLVAYAAKYMKDTEIAREIVQDFFVRLFEKRQLLSIDTSVKSYLYRSVYNCCINYINQQNIHNNHIKKMDAEREVTDNLENEIARLELQQRIASIIDSLPHQCRRIFKMNRFEGLRNEEIAAALHLSKRTVETQISKALRVLRSKLPEANYEGSAEQ